MHKELFDIFDESEPEIIEADDEKEEEILINLARILNGDQISSIVAEWMEYNNMDVFASRTYDKKTGSNLLHFRMEAEFGYYLDDIEDDENG